MFRPLIYIFYTGETYTFAELTSVPSLREQWIEALGARENGSC